MRSERLSAWDNAPSFAAAGTTIMPAEMMHGRGFGSRWVIVIEGAAVHRRTGARIEGGMAAVFRDDEPIDWEVVEDLRYWLAEFEPGSLIAGGHP